MEMIELHELWGHETELSGFRYDFTKLDPSWEPSIWYACSDAICTWRLFKLLAPEVMADQKTIYMIEKQCVAATRWMARNRIYVDRDKVIELVKLGQQEWFDSIMDLYTEANKILGRDVMPGYYKVLRDNFSPDDYQRLVPDQIEHAKGISQLRYPDAKGIVNSRGKDWPSLYDVNSPQQIGVMFDEMRVPGLKRTDKTGQVSTKKADLDEIIESAGTKFPFMGKIKRFREVWKALGSYLYPMLLDAEPSDGTIRINFQQLGTDTGRFSTPAKEDGRADVPGWPKINLQSMPKTGDPHRPACMDRLRECIAARPGSFIVAIDYAGVELRIVTNLSKEPKWLAEFFRCSGCNHTFDRGNGAETPMPPPPRCPSCGSDKIGDLHTLTGLEVFGKDAINRPDWKILRGHAKGTNFALCYGGGGSAVMRSTGCDKNEGWRIKHQFDATYKGLRGWWDVIHKFAREHGYVLTALNRKYPVPDITSADGGFRSKAERNSVNGPVQGTSADITKVAMGFIYRRMKELGWLDRVRLIITMHDELVFEVDGPLLEQAIDEIVPIMTRNGFILNLKWPVPLTTDTEIGYNWTVPWDLNGMRAGEVRFMGAKKIKAPDKVPSGHSWDDLPRWPADLETLFQRKTFDGAPAPRPVAPPPPPLRLPVEAPTPPPTGVAPRDYLDEVELDNAPQTNDLDVAEDAEDEPVEPKPASPQTSVVVPTSGNDFVYKVNKPLTITVALILAEVIRLTRNGGTKRLRLVSSTGASLDDWLLVCGHPEVFVAEDEFALIARSRGL